MALSATLGVSTNMALSGQKVDFVLTISNPAGGTAVSITSVAPYVSPAGAAYNLGRPVISTPEAPFYLAAGSSLVLQWGEAFFCNQVSPAQSNTPTGSFLITCGVLVRDSSGTQTASPTVTVSVFPALGVNTGTATSLPPGGAAFASANYDSGLIAALH